MKTFWDYQEEQDVINSKATNKKGEEAISQKERQEILDAVSSYKTDTIRDKVAWVLNHYPETRD